VGQLLEILEEGAGLDHRLVLLLIVRGTKEDIIANGTGEQPRFLTRIRYAPVELEFTVRGSQLAED
jgi:hypothetical protein